MLFAPEPPRPGDTASRTAVLLVNLGTPDAPTPGALRRYLREFLSDPRVVEIPRLLWKPLLYGVILPTRPAKSAAKYKSIWTSDGSPLGVWTQRQAKLLAGYLGQRGHRVLVRHAMRYGSPSIASQLDCLKADGATRILVLPLYPQYAGATTGSAVDAVAAWATRTRSVPELRFVNSYHDDTGYIDALAASVLAHWQAHGRGGKLVISFHGVPARSVAHGDPYEAECRRTAQRLAERLTLRTDQVVVAFQSRFGRARWLEPSTDKTLKQLAATGTERVDVICPGFAADCLETLEEIAQEGRDAFIGAGGREFHYIACLNDRHEWIAALSALAIRHLQGWATTT
jgi:ferrochelatase